MSTSSSNPVARPGTSTSESGCCNEPLAPRPCCAATLPTSESGLVAVKMAADALSVDYGGAMALGDVSMAIAARKITAIIGPSGCGKSTFLGALNRMVELTARCRVTGRVLLDDQDIYAPDVNATSLRRRVGMIFQKPTPFPLSIRKNITLALADQGITHKSEQNSIVERSLNDVGLWEEVKDRLDRSAMELSGGNSSSACASPGRWR